MTATTVRLLAGLILALLLLVAAAGCAAAQINKHSSSYVTGVTLMQEARWVAGDAR